MKIELCRANEKREYLMHILRVHPKFICKSPNLKGNSDANWKALMRKLVEIYEYFCIKIERGQAAVDALAALMYSIRI